ncbi:MAG: transporter permease [Firmicutes bacterium]|nr:transporter permease [Bacillota bacterium]
MKFFSFFYRKNKYIEDVAEQGIEYTSYYQDSFRRLKKNNAAMICLSVLALMVLIVIFAPWISPQDPNAQSLKDALRGPSAQYFLGTDEYGRDILSRIIYGTRISLSVGIISQVLATAIGVTMGVLAGYYGGYIDSLISRVMEIFAAFPELIFAMGIMYVLGPGVSNIFIALALLSWVSTARLIRGQVLQLKQKEYVEACIASGGASFQIIVRHLVPNCISTIIIMVTLGIPGAIMSEAALSFLGLGVQPPTASWGSMISAAQSYISLIPLYSVLPGLAIIIVVISFNIFGDGLRDALDPKLKNQ